MTTTKPPIEGVLWYALSAQDAAERMGVDPDQGLSVDEAVRRLAEYGPNELPTEPPPSVWTVAWPASLSRRWRRVSWCWGW
jgi:Ca2+-transporting ATPase